MLAAPAVLTAGLPTFHRDGCQNIRKVRVGQVGHEHADGAGLAAHRALGSGIGAIAQLATALCTRRARSGFGPGPCR
ncbi:hypothetical protein GCM10010390_36520 [Streptomyces mordarskii]|uniref:Uncharacterized protein n=1 Tax=Streptomyces mordarskii TaxID=1226758 RepID=A0ABN1D0L7_9ACTN